MVLLEGAQVSLFTPQTILSSMPSKAFSSVGGLKVWHEVLRIVELLLVLSVGLVDDILKDGLDAGVDLP